MSGWTPKRAVAQSKRQLASAIERLRAVSIQWDDVDNTYVVEAEQFIADLQAFATRIETEVAERLAAGEHIGL